MISETALLESAALRSSVLERTDVLDRVKALSLLPDGMHVTTAMVATSTPRWKQYAPSSTIAVTSWRRVDTEF
ncbi:hypothetical protein [Streptomyces sp. NPDC045251]|uniref:hypothetical protein n=1 Tax=unclassified Streptomyces TaxID=2593676 RepID=UPI0034035749